MINPVTVLKMLNERKNFIANHPEFFAYILEEFGSGVEEKTIIQVSVTRPGKDTSITDVKVQESDLKLFRELKEVIKSL